MTKDAFGFFVEIDYFEIIKQNLNDYGIEYTPILELVLPGIKKKLEFWPLNNNYNTNEDNAEYPTGDMNLKKISIVNSSIKKDCKVFKIRVVKKSLKIIFNFD